MTKTFPLVKLDELFTANFFCDNLQRFALPGVFFIFCLCLDVSKHQSGCNVIIPYNSIQFYIGLEIIKNTRCQ